MEKVLGQSELDILNTIINYNSFDKYSDNCANYPRVIAAKHLLDGDFWNNNISDKLLNAVCYVYKRENDGTLNENLCDYLYYWLGSKVLKNLRLKHFFYEVIKIIYDILGKGKHGKICDRAKYSIHDYNFQKFKDIFDLSENYNTYKLHFLKINPACDKYYEDEFNSYLFLYNSLRNECTIENTNHNEEYCKVFNKYFTNKKHSEITSWKCKLIESEELVQQLEKYHSGEAEKSPLPARTEITVGQKHYRPGLSETGQFVENLSALHPGLLEENPVMASASDHPEDSSPSTIKKSITSAVSAAGVLVPPFLIYNYAPARSWIYKLLGMNKGTNRNPYANQELMADFSMPEDFYSERNRYNIMYNPE
ncbi:VIR protein [Plasmodium vivax]|uniref:VIR protein n=1 Tax=Plasmodium vivax TaxID=5855 RepID=A0A1G4E9J1_PLAVI|nr:VIR protein [Plasmodium vivax]